MHSPSEAAELAAEYLRGDASEGSSIPLVGEKMRIVIYRGLAFVTREQRFRNREQTSIEATITFPVPTHATLCRLTARIGKRVLTAQAQAKEKARETYERAVDEGKTAVLHEELVRGVHMLSITHIPPGEEITVSHAWILPLAPKGAGKALLRIPVTLGDVYGRSPLCDADDLVTSPHVIHEADIEVDAGGANATVRGLAKGEMRLRLDAPVDIDVSGDIWGASQGRTADGRAVTVSVAPDAIDEAEIAAAVLVDRSGSMASGASLRGRGGLTKHQSIKAGLIKAAHALKPRDRVELWQFDTSCERVSGPEIPLAKAVGKLEDPSGGTEIGGALMAVLAASATREIILITDGLSHALDVQALANSGRRFTVVLVGDDALEANVGRLAALTGGEIFLAAGEGDPAEAVRAAIASARRTAADFAVTSWPLDKVSTHVGGALVSAQWSQEKAPIESSEFDQAVGALAAAIALPSLPEEQAWRVAVDHGIVCHLTSLVLVDEAGAVQEGLPTQRKIALMEAKYSAPVELALLPSHAAPMRSRAMRLTHSAMKPMARQAPSFLGPLAAEPEAPSLAVLARRIDWARDPEALRRGELDQLPDEIADRVRDAAQLPEVLALGGPGRNPAAVVLALMARSLGMWKRSAARVARSILKGLDPEDVKRAATALGLLHMPSS